MININGDAANRTVAAYRINLCYFQGIYPLCAKLIHNPRQQLRFPGTRCEFSLLSHPLYSPFSESPVRIRHRRHRRSFLHPAYLPRLRKSAQYRCWYILRPVSWKVPSYHLKAWQRHQYFLFTARISLRSHSSGFRKVHPENFS